MDRNKYIYRVGKSRPIFVAASGRRIARANLPAHLAHLAVPPAWTDVELVTNPRAKIWATGHDEAGRKQYIYNPTFRAKREAEKFDRIILFAEQLSPLRVTTRRHLALEDLCRERVLACMVRLLDRAYFRVGNREYACENKTYGLTTLRSRHLKIRGDSIIFEFIGKHDVEQKHVVADKKLAEILRELSEVPGYHIFSYFTKAGDKVDVASEHLNEYIRELIGEEFSAKDFRTWAGTLIAATTLADKSEPEDEKARAHNIVLAVEQVASKLGNTPAVARSSYIDPRVFEFYGENVTIGAFMRKNVRAHERLLKRELNLKELALWRMLKSA
ncbi:DNA topoisomerase IB [Candidatus Berkelbacteria bacterium]|nr:DNA topoisomerase IB [Candidatus Berkelbacteria bacterium]